MIILPKVDTVLNMSVTGLSQALMNTISYLGRLNVWIFLPIINNYSVAKYQFSSLISGVIKNEQQLVLAPLYVRLAILIRTLLPSLYRFIMNKRALKEKKYQWKNKLYVCTLKDHLYLFLKYWEIKCLCFCSCIFHWGHSSFQASFLMADIPF